METSFESKNDFVSLDYLALADKYMKNIEIWDNDELWQLRVLKYYPNIQVQKEILVRSIYQKRLLVELLDEIQQLEYAYMKDPVYMKSLAELQASDCSNLSAIQGHSMQLGFIRAEYEEILQKKRREINKLQEHIRGCAFPFQQTYVQVQLPRSKLLNLRSIHEKYQFASPEELLEFLLVHKYLPKPQTVHHGLLLHFKHVDTSTNETLIYFFPHPERDQLEYEVKSTSPLSWYIDEKQKRWKGDYFSYNHDYAKSSLANLYKDLIEYLGARSEGSQYIIMEKGIFYRVWFRNDKILSQVPYQDN